MGGEVSVADARHRQRVDVFYGAVLALLSHEEMSATEVGRVLYGRGAIATARAMGGMLALRTNGLIDARSLGQRAKWRLAEDGCAWLTEALAIRGDAAVGGWRPT